MSTTALRGKSTPRVKVNVTADLIVTSIRSNSSHCMVAEAVKAAYPNAKMVSVDIQTIRFTDPTKGERYTYLTPRVAQERILAFDEGSQVKPFSFQLRSGQVSRGGVHKAKASGESRAPKKKINGADDGKTMPTVVGGQPPPLTRVGRRRIFGLRALTGTKVDE